MNNNYELNQHKKSDAVKWIVVFTLIILLLAGMIASLTLVLSDGKNKPAANNAQNEAVYENDFAAEMQGSPHIKLAMSSEAVTAADNSVSKTITATVLPATASNKTVDWTVEWGDETNTSDVSQYITVTPSSNGSTTATVTCKQPFSGNILVTVKTRESGYTASCVVTFNGLPTDMTISTSVAQENGFYKVGIGNAYTFGVALTNPFNSVGAQYNDITCEVTGIGSFNIGSMEYYHSSGNKKWYEDSIQVVTLDSLKGKFITVNYENGNIVVNTLKSIESYYGSVRIMDGGRTSGYKERFYSYVDDCYFRVTVTENTSGLSKSFNIRFDDAVVTGVNLGNTEMEF